MATQHLQDGVAAHEEVEYDQGGEELSIEDLWVEIDQKARQHSNLSGAKFAQ